MIFAFQCENCGKRYELDFKIGEAPRSIECPICKGKAKRVYESVSFILKGSGWPSKTLSLKTEMTKKNELAGERMKGRESPMKLAALDYGNGDVREVQKK